MNNMSPQEATPHTSSRKPPSTSLMLTVMRPSRMAVSPERRRTMWVEPALDRNRPAFWAADTDSMTHGTVLRLIAARTEIDRREGIEMARRTPTTTLTVLSASDARRHAEARVQDGDELLLLLDVTLMYAEKADIDRRDSHAREDIGAVAGQIVSIQIERDRRAWRARYAHVMDRLEQDAA